MNTILGQNLVKRELEEFTSMTKAYILINCDLGSEEQVKSDLKDIDCVKDVYGTYGAYDILADLESDTCEDLRQLIIQKIRKLKQVRSTITLMGIDGQC